MERTRTRAVVQLPLRYTAQYYTGAEEAHSAFLVNRETTVDEEHPWYAWQNLRKLETMTDWTTGVDIGGEFTSVKTSCELLNRDSYDLKAWPHEGDWLYKFRGQLVPDWLPLAPPQKDVSDRVESQACDFKSHPQHWLLQNYADSDSELGVLGASAIADLSPTAPHNSVFTSLGELRNDGLPSVPLFSFLKDKDFVSRYLKNKDRSESLSQKAGGEYLNYQFGIAPTIADVKKIRETVIKADKLWKQYLRDSGKIVRRRMVMDPEISTSTGVYPRAYWETPHGTTHYHWSSVGPITDILTVSKKRWVSAAYLYYVSGESLAGMDGWLEKANHLYGWKPTPSAAYNLTAFSWLLDWFTNTGDVIDNVSLYLEDPFLVRWAYIMETSVIERNMSQTLVTNEGKSILLQFRIKSEIKKRRRINPFYFGLKGEALNGHQLAILAALGMSRGRNPGSM